LTLAHKLHPEKFILASEQCIERKVEKRKVELGEWVGGVRYGLDILENLRHWASGWIDWNLCLNLEGGPNWVNNFVESPIIVDGRTDEFYKQPTFYFMAHFSKFIPRGSVRIGSARIRNGPRGRQMRAIKHVAFLAPNLRDRVLVLINIDPVNSHNVEIRDFQMNNKNKFSLLKLKPLSIVTAIWSSL